MFLSQRVILCIPHQVPRSPFYISIVGSGSSDSTEAPPKANRSPLALPFWKVVRCLAQSRRLTVSHFPGEKEGRGVGVGNGERHGK